MISAAQTFQTGLQRAFEECLWLLKCCLQSADGGEWDGHLFAFPIDACAARRKKINQCDRLIHLSNTPAHSHPSHHLSNTTDRAGHTHTHTYIYTPDTALTQSVLSLLWSFMLLVPLSSNHLSALYKFLKKKKRIFESGHIWNSSKPWKNTGNKNHRKCLDNEAAKWTHTCTRSC